MTAGPCVIPACVSTVTRRYTTGAACAPHSPWGHAGRPDPDSFIDPTRIERAMRIRPTPIWAKGATDLNKEKPGGYKSRQRAVREAVERDALSTLQHPTRKERNG